VPGRPFPDDIAAVRVLDEPLQLLTGPGHALAGARSVTVAQLAGHRIWMPGIVPGTEWAAYYDDLVAEFGLTIEATGPNFGSDALLDTIADTPSLATFMGGHTRLVWPAGHGLRRIPVTDPTPVYPHALLWHRDNPHPALATLRAHLAAAAPGHDAAGTWAPDWVIPR
jgi:DNA-binding transcriptional LysR family regulator